MKIIVIVLSAALLLCLAPMPYGYYTLVRFVSMIIFAVLAWQMWQREVKAMTVVFGAMALLFQPFVKIALGRGLWNIVDVAAAALLIVMLVRKQIK